MCECLTQRWLLKQGLEEKWVHAKGWVWESAIPHHQGLDGGTLKSCWWLLHIPSSGLVSPAQAQPTTSKTRCCAQLSTGNSSKSRNFRGMYWLTRERAYPGSLQRFKDDLNHLHVPRQGHIHSHRNNLQFPPWNAALGWIQIFLRGMGSSSSKRQHLSGHLKSNLMAKNGTRDQLTSNSKKCRQLVREQML